MSMSLLSCAPKKSIHTVPTKSDSEKPTKTAAQTRDAYLNGFGTPYSDEDKLKQHKAFMAACQFTDGGTELYRFVKDKFTDRSIVPLTTDYTIDEIEVDPSEEFMSAARAMIKKRFQDDEFYGNSVVDIHESDLPDPELVYGIDLGSFPIKVSENRVHLFIIQVAQMQINSPKLNNTEISKICKLLLTEDPMRDDSWSGESDTSNNRDLNLPQTSKRVPLHHGRLALERFINYSFFSLMIGFRYIEIIGIRNPATNEIAISHDKLKVVIPKRKSK